MTHCFPTMEWICLQSDSELTWTPVARVVRREMSFQLLPDVLVFPYPGFEVKAMKEIQKLVSMGFQAEFCICETSDEAKHYAAAKGIPTLYFVGEDIVEVRV